jgi:hypothetical protein
LKPGIWKSHRTCNLSARSVAYAAALWFCIAGAPGFASSSDQNPDYIMNTRGVGRVDKSYVTSDQMLELGLTTPETLRLEGEQCLRTGNIDRALTVLQRSVEMAPLDMEGRILYAAALGRKFEERRGQDNALFNFLVKQWLFIYKRSDFPDQQQQALSQIAALTETKPKRFESEKKFLGRVLRPEDANSAFAKLALHTDDQSAGTDTGHPVAHKKRSELDTSAK